MKVKKKKLQMVKTMMKKEYDNNRKKKTITYKLNFIDSYRFMQINYQTLLITYPEFLIINAKNAWKQNKLK